MNILKAITLAICITISLGFVMDLLEATILKKNSTPWMGLFVGALWGTFYYLTSF